MAVDKRIIISQKYIKMKDVAGNKLIIASHKVLSRHYALFVAAVFLSG
jgi:hypothetical protein